MSAIEHCRSAALDGHVLQCRACDHTQIAYNSCTVNGVKPTSVQAAVRR
ncbi:MAG: transposase zinc-binding domain-containing protein [Anaerolineales bacterium]